MHFVNKKFYILIKISMQLVPKDPINNNHNGLAPNTRQTIIWTSAYPLHWRIFTALGGDELINQHIALLALIPYLRKMCKIKASTKGILSKTSLHRNILCIYVRIKCSECYWFTYFKYACPQWMIHAKLVLPVCSFNVFKMYSENSSSRYVIEFYQMAQFILMH